jgi:tetratricopeptide (TPR) repeat protein
MASIELDELFASLRSARTPEQAAAIERAIWQHWMRSDDPRVSAAMTRGVEAMNAGEHRKALAAFDGIVRIAPDLAEGWNKRATVHWLMGDHAASLADIERTLALEPRHFGALSGLALIHQAQGRVFEALDALERIARVHPHLPHLGARIAALQRGVAQGA